MINEASDKKEVWKICNSLLNKTKNTTLPLHDDNMELANRFNDFFIDKVKTIRSTIENTKTVVNTSYMPNCDHYLSSIPPATTSSLLKIIKSSPSKSCCLDPIPNDILKQCVNSLIVPITTIVNASLSSGEVPSDLKQAVVKPLHKKATLDQNSLKSYKPVSNLPYLLKILERYVDNHFYST